MTVITFRNGNPPPTYVLRDAEPGWDSVNKILKIGDGVTPWSDLPLQGSASAEDIDEVVDAALEALTVNDLVQNEGAEAVVYGAFFLKSDLSGNSEEVFVNSDGIVIGSTDGERDLVAFARLTKGALTFKTSTSTFEGALVSPDQIDNNIQWHLPNKEGNLALESYGVQNINGVAGIWRGTQAQYSAITPDPSVLYFIVPGA